jgi:uncharacterized protein Usg
MMLKPAAQVAGLRLTSSSKLQKATTESGEMGLALQLRDYRLTTAEILYRMPDHPELLQAYIWQDLDLAPRYPVLRKFLDFWERELDGKLYSVRIATASLIRPARFRTPGAFIQFH